MSNSTPLLERKLTPREIAESYGVNQSKVLAWIHSGQLRAVDVSSNPGSGRPRWRVSPAALADWEVSRTCSPPEPKARRRRRKDPDLVEYF